MNKEIWKKFYPCDCGTEGIVLNNEWEEEEIPYLDLAIFSSGFRGEQLSFRNRLRWCWKILKTGFPYTDSIILTKKIAWKLGEDLVKWGIG